VPMSDIAERARKALGKKATYGPDVDLEKYDVEAKPHEEIQRLEEIPEDVRKAALGVGVTLEKEVGGAYIQMDQTPVVARSSTEGIEVLDIATALKKYDGLRDYWWKLVPVDQDKYTADVALHPPAGYFLRAKRGAKTIFPLKSCLYLGQTNLNQRVHNIIIAEEGSELHVITGCTTPSHVQRGLHLGVSEFFIKKGAHVSFTMIHNWGREVEVRPRTAIYMEEGATLSNNYICLTPAKTLQTYPKAILDGKGAVASFNTVLYAKEGHLDTGSEVVLRAPGCSADSITRAVSVGGEIITRGKMVGEVPDVKAHLECVGLILSEKGRIDSIPELDGRCGGLDMSHEAAVGKISELELEYLMARGLTKDQATGVIVRGFLDVEIKGLPESLREELRRITQLQELHGGA